MAAKKNLYETIQEASAAAKALGISSVQEYLNRYKEDAKLPHSPAFSYPMDWKGFPNFLGTENLGTLNNVGGGTARYLTYEEARQAAALIDAYTTDQYKLQRNKNPLLPACPNETYRDEWTGWGNFLPSSPKVLYYATLSEAAIAASRLGITSSGDYIKFYSRDPLLHSNPNQYYPEWKGFPDFFDGSFERYPTYAAAKEATNVGAD